MATSSSSTMTASFLVYQASIEVDQGIREDVRAAVRHWEDATRRAVASLQRVHVHASDAATIINDSTCQPEVFIAAMMKVLEKVPVSQESKFSSLWSNALQQTIFVLIFRYYLESGDLLSLEDVAKLLNVRYDLPNDDGIAMDDGGRMSIDLEDYLHGVISLPSELSRLAVTSVTAGRFHMPVKIAAFLSDLMSSFRLLNLKNDSLRRRFDSIKYDMKKTEEVVYDVTIRGLAKKE